jgi:prepilin-type N-terminal cleavage/methylation domain-containing protein
MFVFSIAGGQVTAANRRGFTLVELMVVVVLMAAMVALALPKSRTLFLRSSVRGARTTVFNAFQQAKVTAVSQGRTATVNMPGAGQLFISAAPRRNPCPGGGCTMDTIGLVRELTTQYGVTLTPSQATYAYDSRGLGPNTPVTVELRRDPERDTVWVSGFGRVEK